MTRTTAVSATCRLRPRMVTPAESSTSVSRSPCALRRGSPLATRSRQMSAPVTVQASENHSVRYSPMAGTVRAGIHEPRQPTPTE